MWHFSIPQKAFFVNPNINTATVFIYLPLILSKQVGTFSLSAVDCIGKSLRRGVELEIRQIRQGKKHCIKSRLRNVFSFSLTSVSYKNHKKYKKDQSEWVITYNNHEPIISQELWDKVRERRKSKVHGRKTKIGFTHPLSGFLVCADCGCKMKMNTSVHKEKRKGV